jgi:hypothetical protein
MAIPVLIEPVGKKGFRATSGEPLAMTVEAPTREKALAKLEKQLQARLTNGAELVAWEPTPANAWVKFAGMFKDSPMFDEVVEIMAENRRKDDAETDGS